MYLILCTLICLFEVTLSFANVAFQNSVPPIPFRSLASSFPANFSQGSGHSWSLARRQNGEPAAGSCDVGSFQCPDESCCPNDKQCCGTLCCGSAYYCDPTGPDLSLLACCPLDGGGCDYGSNVRSSFGLCLCALTEHRLAVWHPWIHLLCALGSLLSRRVCLLPGLLKRPDLRAWRQ